MILLIVMKLLALKSEISSKSKKELFRNAWTLQCKDSGFVLLNSFRRKIDRHISWKAAQLKQQKQKLHTAQGSCLCLSGELKAEHQRGLLCCGTDWWRQWLIINKGAVSKETRSGPISALKWLSFMTCRRLCVVAGKPCTYWSNNSVQ